MIDAYTIGVRLALHDEISAGLKTVRRELVVLDRAVTASGAGLRALGQIGAEVGPRARAGLEAGGAGRIRPIGPTAPAPARQAGGATARPAAAGPERRHHVAPATNGISLATALSLARRLGGPAPAGMPAVPTMTRLAVPASAASAAGHRRITGPEVSQPVPRQRAYPAADHRPAPPRHGAVPDRPGSGVAPRGRASGPAVPDAGTPRGILTAQRDAATAAPRAGRPGHPGDRNGTAPAQRGTQVTAQDLAALARRLSAGRPVSTGAQPANRPAVNLRSSVHPGAFPAAAVRRPDQGPALDKLTPHARIKPLHMQAAAPHPLGGAGTGAPSVSARQLGPIRQVLKPISQPFRAPRPTRTATPDAIRGQPPFRSVGPQPDQAPARQADSGEIILDGVRFGRLVAERLTGHLDRPRAGFTGVDPRATPTWPGASIG